MFEVRYHLYLNFHIFDSDLLTLATGTWRYTTNCFEDAISLVDSGLVDMKSLISHVYPFEQGLEAFQTVHDVKAKDGRHVFKVVISDEGK